MSSDHGVRSGWCAAICMVLLGLAAHAQEPSTRRLAAAKSLDCVFTLVVTGTWNDGDPQADLKPTRMSIRFVSIDADEGTAVAVGGFGSSTIIVKSSVEALHFIQSFRDGPLYVTTVFDKVSHAGRLKAVHTRHEYADVSLPGFTSRPEQYYGECEVSQ
jgi:hypothetical protein